MMTSPLQQKLRITGPVIVTANRLRDGAVVHRTPSGEWTANLRDAEVLRSASLAQTALSAASASGSGIVGAYVAPVIETAEGGIAPGNLREAIRSKGPTFDLPLDEAAAQPHRVPSRFASSEERAV